MNKLLITALFLPALAVAEKPTIELCTSLSKYAGMIMEERQGGSDMVTLYESVKDKQILSSIVEEAYSMPRFTSTGYQEKSVSDFKNKWFLACVKST